MKITTKNLDDRQVRLTIKVDEEQTQEAMQRAARQIAKQVNIPGFRKGKAPYKLIVQRYGEETIRQSERLRPDVVLLDVAMPGPGAVDLLRGVRAVLPLPVTYHHEVVRVPE